MKIIVVGIILVLSGCQDIANSRHEIVIWNNNRSYCINGWVHSSINGHIVPFIKPNGSLEKCPMEVRSGD